MLTKSIINLVVVVTLAVATRRYDNHKVYRVVPQTPDQLTKALLLQENESFSVWRNAHQIGQAFDVMVSPENDNLFHSIVNDCGMKPEVRLSNVQQIIDNERKEIEKSRSLTSSRALEWTSYYPLEDINDWLDEKASENDNVETVVAGTTYEGRDIRGITINNGDDLPGVIIEGGIHAREWIGPAATSWIINEILKSSNDSVWRKFNYLYIPVFNPDGYAFTWSDDRLWRKTRKPYGTCVGADPNRNYDNHWLEGGGSSNNPCSETYAGPEAFSEIETKSLSDYFKGLSKNYDIYLAFHSYAQLMLFPWGWTSEHAPLYDLWKRVGDLSADAIESVHGTEFVVGDIYSTIYPASATSSDWYYGEFNSTITYTWETRDTIYGFQLPAKQIIPVAEEHLAGVQVILEEYLKL